MISSVAEDKEAEEALDPISIHDSGVDHVSKE